MVGSHQMIHFRAELYVRLLLTKNTPVSLHCLNAPESQESSQTLRQAGQILRVLNICGGWPDSTKVWWLNK